MKQEQIRDFTRRIAQCNRAGMVVILYDMEFAYLQDACEAFNREDHQAWLQALSHADSVLVRLQKDLNFEYEMSKDLYALYRFCREELAKMRIRNTTAQMEDVKEVLHNLYDGFVAAAKQDHTPPLMRNTQQVYAGMTYGRHDLTESFQDPESSRGFFA